MLAGKEQIAAYMDVIKLCKGTKFEGKEYLCIKYKQPGFDIEYQQYTDDDIDFTVKWDRIFAVAIVDDIPIWLEEPFTLYQANTNLEYSYRKQDNKLVGVYRDHNDCKVLTAIIPMENVIWSYFTIYKSKKASMQAATTELYKTQGIRPNSKQVGGTHYTTKAIQPWAYMEANFTKEEFVGFLRGNVHKYLDRYKGKNGIEDLKKAIHYIEKLIDVEQENDKS